MAFQPYPKIVSINIEAKADQGAYVDISYEENYEDISWDFGSGSKSVLTQQFITLGSFDPGLWQIVIEFEDGRVVVYG